MATPVTPRPLGFARIVVYALPLLFVVVSWLASAGFPYYLDNNESFLMYVEARNLEIWNPWSFAWMTAHTTDPTLPAPEHFYTHNPNGQRYLQYALLRLGIRELAPQILIISVVATALAAALLWRTYGQSDLAVVPLAIVFDYTGFLAWTVNTYRIWILVVFFGLVLAVLRARPRWCGVLAFLVFQVDYGDATFACASAVTLAILVAGWRARSLILAIALGACVSVALFGFQVTAFYGWDGFLHELAITFARRGTVGEPGGIGTFLYHAWHGPALLLGLVSRETHNPSVMVVVVAGLAFAARTLIRRQSGESELMLARVMVSTMVGAMATSAVLYGYFVDGFIVSLLPISTLLIAPSTGLVALELRRLLGPLCSSPHLGAVSAAVALLPVMVASVQHFEPPVAVDLFHLLQTEYRGRTMLAPSIGSWMMNDALAFALTGGRVIRVSGLDATPGDIRRLDALRDSDGMLTYMCLDAIYLRERRQPDALNVCDFAEARMVPRGHQVVANGPGWFIMQIGDEPALAVDEPDPGATMLADRAQAAGAPELTPR